MHSYLRSIGFSKITKRKEMQELIRDVIDSYDEKYVVENHPDGTFAEFSKIMDVIAGSPSADSMMKTISFRWNIPSPFLGGQGLPRRRKLRLNDMRIRNLLQVLVMILELV